MNDYDVMYVGAFTREYQPIISEFMGEPATGMDVVALGRADGAMGRLGTVEGLISPSWVTFHPFLPVIYALERQVDLDRPGPGALSSFVVDKGPVDLRPQSRTPTSGTSPSFVSVHSGGGHAYVTHYRSGHVVSLPLDQDGRVGESDASARHELPGPAGETAPPGHPHQILVTPSGDRLSVTDLALDSVSVYATGAGGVLDPARRTDTTLAGAGPRHHAFHPEGRFTLVCGEKDSTLTVLERGGPDRPDQIVGRHSTLPESWPGGLNAPAEVLVHPSGRTVYVSNRGHDSIAVFEFDPASGFARLAGTQSARGSAPRGMTLSPRGDFLIVANQGSGNLASFRVDALTGWPEFTGHELVSPSPCCLAFAPDHVVAGWRGR